jgi:hypothetical protein
MLAVGPRVSGSASDSDTPSTAHDMVLWAVVIPSVSLAVFVRSLFTTLREAPAAASDLPPSFLQLFHANVGITQLLLGCLLRFLTTLTLSAAFSAAAWLAPSWYLQGGREQVLAAARLLPKAITVLQLLLLPSGPLEELQRVWLQTCTVGAKGLLAVMVWPLLFPVRAPASRTLSTPTARTRRMSHVVGRGKNARVHRVPCASRRRAEAALYRLLLDDIPLALHPDTALRNAVT